MTSLKWQVWLCSLAKIWVYLHTWALFFLPLSNTQEKILHTGRLILSFSPIRRKELKRKIPFFYQRFKKARKKHDKWNSSFTYLLLYGSGNPCSCLVLQLHISGRWFPATTLYRASPYIHAFYLQSLRESETTVHKIDVHHITSRSQPATTTTTTNNNNNPYLF